MSRPESLYGAEWPLRTVRPGSTVSSSTQSSGSASLTSVSNFPFPPSPATSSPESRSRQASLYDDVVRLALTPAVTISFIRNNKLFKLRYTYIDIRKDSTGCLKALELGGGAGQQTPFIHSFNSTRLPVPHLEHPKVPLDTSLRISFMEEQTVQTAHTVFSSKISYTFEEWTDCLHFQELILAAKLVFLAGVAEAKSKGRGEECVSQNLRVLRGAHGRLAVLFFANSQRKELKRYVSIPVTCIERVIPGKKPGKPLTLQLQPNFDLLAQMKTLQILFLDDQDQKAFCEFLAEHTQ